MKRRDYVLSFLAAVILSLPLLGCKTAAGPTPPLAPGYSSQADETIGRSLAAARGYYVQIQSDVAAGKYKPSPAEVTAYNSFGLTLNTAEVAYLAFHNGTGTIQAAQDATSKVTAQQAALQAVQP